jgi:hypothetical protein
MSQGFSPDGLRRSAFNSTPSDLAHLGANNTFKVPLKCNEK